MGLEGVHSLLLVSQRKCCGTELWGGSSKQGSHRSSGVHTQFGSLEGALCCACVFGGGIERQQFLPLCLPLLVLHLTCCCLPAQAGCTLQEL